jgi:hypothetical protein
VKKQNDAMDNLSVHPQATVRLLLAFLAFGAACSSLWAWLIATAGEQRQAMESLTRSDQNSATPPPRR